VISGLTNPRHFIQRRGLRSYAKVCAKKQKREDHAFLDLGEISNSAAETKANPAET